MGNSKLPENNELNRLLATYLNPKELAFVTEEDTKASELPADSEFENLLDDLEAPVDARPKNDDEDSVLDAEEETEDGGGLTVLSAVQSSRVSGSVSIGGLSVKAKIKEDGCDESEATAAGITDYTEDTK